MLHLFTFSPFLDPSRQRYRDIRRDIGGIGSGAKTGIITQFDGEIVRNPGTPADEEHFVPKLFSLSQFDEPGEVFDVDVLLGHYLGNEDRIGIFGPGTAQQLFRRHLGAEVDSVNH